MVLNDQLNLVSKLWPGINEEHSELIFIVGASFAQKIVTGIRYQVYDHKHKYLGLTPEAQKALIKKQENEDQLSIIDEPFVKDEIEKVKKAVAEMKKATKEQKPLDLNDPETKKKLEKIKELQKKRTIEDIHMEMRKKDLNNWENKRIPRPWEEKDETD